MRKSVQLLDMKCNSWFNLAQTRLRNVQKSGYLLNMKSKTPSAAAALKKLREFANLTLEQVATEASTSVSYLSSVENGRVQATPEYITRIALAVSKRMAASEEDVPELEVAS